MRIHERCNKPGRLDYSGVDALRGYRYEWDEKDQCFSRAPIHNWASHSADAFRYMAIVARQTELNGRAEAPSSKPAAVPMQEAYTLDDAWAAREAGRRWSRD